ASLAQAIWFRSGETIPTGLLARGRGSSAMSVDIQVRRHLEEGLAVPSVISVAPLLEHAGPVTGQSPINLSPDFPPRLGGAFSFFCTLKADGIDTWFRVFDFSSDADDESITAGVIEHTHDLHFTVFRGKIPMSVRVNDFFEEGQEFSLLCTVSVSGHMKVFKDGGLVGENQDGLPPVSMERPHMIVGGHFLYHKQAFHGSIRDVKVWDQEVTWPMVQVEPALPESEADVGLAADASSMITPSRDPGLVGGVDAMATPTKLPEKMEFAEDGGAQCQVPDQIGASLLPTLHEVIAYDVSQGTEEIPISSA
ncbi:unnamed protein product, partial [Prorocentrum cordatum]